MSQRQPFTLSRRALLRGLGATSAALTVPAPLASWGDARALSGTRPPAQVPALFQPLIQKLQAVQASLKVPGVSFAVMFGGQSYAGGFGETVTSPAVPVDAGTLFLAGSITKTITGAALLRLIELGAVGSLDDKVVTYVPSLTLQGGPAVAQNVTLKHLMTHTGGWWGDYMPGSGYGPDMLAQFVGQALPLTPQIAPLGRFYNYANNAFSLAGYVIQLAYSKAKGSSVTYEQAIQELIFDPIGMTGSSFFPAPIVPGGQAPPNASGVVNPAGGMVTSAQELLTYMAWLLSGGQTANGGSYMAESIPALFAPLGPGGAYGFTLLDGFGVAWGRFTLPSPAGAFTVFQKDGAWASPASAGVQPLDYESLLTLVLPQNGAGGFGLAVLTNAQAGAFLAQQVTTWALQQYLGLQQPVRTPLPYSDEQLAPYLGSYAVQIPPPPPNNHEIVNWTAGDGTLMFGPDPFTFYTIDGEPQPDQVVWLETGIVNDFQRDASGAIKWTRFGGRQLPWSSATPQT